MIILYVYTVLKYMILVYLIDAYYDTLRYLQLLTYCNRSLNVEVRLNLSKHVCSGQKHTLHFSFITIPTHKNSSDG